MKVFMRAFLITEVKDLLADVVASTSRWQLHNGQKQQCCVTIMTACCAADLLKLKLARIHLILQV
jgi:hypothetical protein